MNRIVIGIVYYSGVDLLMRCLASIPQTDNIHTVVLDTSPDGSAEHVARLYSCQYVEGERNAGYAWGLGEIARLAVHPNDVFVASNSDVSYEPGSLERLASLAMMSPSVCYPVQLESPNGPIAHYNVFRQLDARDSVARWIGIGRRQMARDKNRILRRLSTANSSPIAIPAGYCGSGAVFAIRGDIWTTTGGLDTRFFLYEEDRAFGTTLERLDIPALLIPSAIVVHEGGVRTRGLDLGTLREALLSERLYWQREGRRPANLPLWLQRFGVMIRLMRSFFINTPTTAVYWSLTKELWAMRSGGVQAPRDFDGYRKPFGGSEEDL